MRSSGEVDARGIQAAWGLSGPVALRAVGSGTNNRTRYVDTPGGSYVLRVYVNTRNAARVRYEHAILRGLQTCDLPFGVPAPIPAADGETLAALEEGALAALFPLLPGTPPDRTNPAHVRACGTALAALHGALRRLDVGPPPEGVVTYGDLDRIHPLVPDPWSLARELPLEGGERERLTEILAALREMVPGLYASLPVQLCHNDYGPGNTLAIDGRTSAVLDFEFAGPDLRGIDVAVGWYWSVGPSWGTGGELPIIRAFLAGYASGERLTEEEVEAMPALARLLRAAGLVHRTGRWRAGLATEADALEQARLLLALDAWLDAHADALKAACRMPGAVGEPA